MVGRWVGKEPTQGSPSSDASEGARFLSSLILDMRCRLESYSQAPFLPPAKHCNRLVVFAPAYDEIPNYVKVLTTLYHKESAHIVSGGIYYYMVHVGPQSRVRTSGYTDGKIQCCYSLKFSGTLPRCSLYQCAEEPTATFLWLAVQTGNGTRLGMRLD